MARMRPDFVSDLDPIKSYEDPMNMKLFQHNFCNILLHLMNINYYN